MHQLAHWAAYGSLLIFLVAVGARYWRIQSYPLHIRWEIYPIPHEGAVKAAYGGSKMEESDYWTKPHKPDRLTEYKFMFFEMVLIKGLWEHNRKMWYRSFPFHFGLYLLAGFIGMLVLGAVAQMAGVPMGAASGGLGAAISGLTQLLGVGGMALSFLGALGLLIMRVGDPELKPYTNGAHYFNLLVIMAVEALGLLSWASCGFHFGPFRDFVHSLLLGRISQPIGNPILGVTIITASLLIAYIPLTHMSHFFVKWFTWHKIRWDDEPNVKGGRIEKMIQKALMYPVSWQAEHIAGDGKKNWADVATKEMNHEQGK